MEVVVWSQLDEVGSLSIQGPFTLTRFLPGTRVHMKFVKFYEFVGKIIAVETKFRSLYGKFVRIHECL